MFLVLRAAGDATSLSGPLRAAMHRLDPTQPLGEIRTLREEIDDSLAPLRTLGGLLSGLAAMAFFLATVGIYGVTSTRVAQRRRELAVRAAIGASPSTLGWSVLSQALRAGAVGCALGGAATVLIARVTASRVFGLLEPSAVLLTVLGIVLCAAAVAAGWFPARRAMRADPVTALRM
jgi:ABC-type antimicrobial peptide transport system permease subunit